MINCAKSHHFSSKSCWFERTSLTTKWYFATTQFLCVCVKKGKNVMSSKVRGSDVAAKLKLKTTEIKSNYFTKQIKKINIFHEKSLRIRRFIVKSRRQFSWEWPLGFLVLFAQMIWPLSVMTIPLQFITFILCNNEKRPKYVSWMEPENDECFHEKKSFQGSLMVCKSQSYLICYNYTLPMRRHFL